ncbi:MAG: ABC transporter substrate-binding protein, partial [Actinobacteria bacterium]|nr:ABC transporter substrate-binding protein [Actinomycetota bacterium]
MRIDRSYITRSRVALVCLAAATLVLALCGAAARAGSTTTINFQLDWVPDQSYGGYYEADAKGYYSAAGLKVNFLSGGNVASTASVIAGGGAQIGIVSNMARLYDANKSGANLVAIGAVLQTSPAALMSLPSLKITKISDLDGKKIGTDPPGKADINALFAVHHLKPDWTFVPVGYDAAPLFKHVIDAYYVYAYNQPIPYELKGQHSNVTTFAQLGFNTYSGLIVTSKSFLASHKSAVKAFLAATQKGWQAALADPAGAVQLTLTKYGKNLGLDEKTALAEFKAQIPFVESAYTKTHGLLAMDPSAITGSMAAA